VFSNSGTEIVQVALRLARAITGRRRYLKFEGHYHGWSDEVLVSYKPGAGHTDSRAPAPTGLGQLATESAVVAQWNERASVEAAFERTPDGISAILCEPLLANSGCIPPAPGFLEFLRETATRQGALLIFDEVITGFRLAPGGAQEYFGVQADLATYAKALGAGTPLSALAGRREFLDWIADGRVVHAGTLNGNPLCLAAAKVALAELRRPGVYAQLHRLGDQLRAGLVEALGGRAVATGIGPVFQLHFQAEAPRSYRDTWAHDKAAYSDFLVELLDAGVMPLPDGRWYLSLAHTEEDVRETLERAREVGRRYAR
jgi:glutamate-1-semialdehyde 2,1-aminomutase